MKQDKDKTVMDLLEQHLGRFGNPVKGILEGTWKPPQKKQPLIDVGEDKPKKIDRQGKVVNIKNYKVDKKKRNKRKKSKASRKKNRRK